MLLEVDPASPVPPYEQIRAQLATMIITGALAEDAQLPTIRQLAADLGLAANTVARAYRELESAGLVRSRVRHGTTVAAVKPLAPKEIRQRLADAAQAYVATTRRLGVSAAEARAAITSALGE
ncbi:GntR family transcriptional regulator [Rhizocola hellebori]|uniref:GntR family transcriptional regulator n=1 Tax=Rhizocola hellebori TaxID=1392758 RepID=A0A8J3VIR0_9ACTN|nr:GntR family transcriptional regulator [Rhizocola hellebori]GIH08664.1 GntR family transcriptional regulator [Rhizocola hellebori]